jgi:hypothetical protein
MTLFGAHGVPCCFGPVDAIRGLYRWPDYLQPERRDGIVFRLAGA